MRQTTRAGPIVILALGAGILLHGPLPAASPPKNVNDVADYLETYRAGAKAGVPEDEYNLGASYRWGLGTDKNLSLAAQWIRKAAEQGYPIAERTIGEMYEKGEGLPASDVDAKRWYKRGALHGDSIAHADLAALEAKIHPLGK
jgi:TPR repeat protein